jgi:3-phosphoshikimate 1-carboxyvinyltransferase
MIVRLHHPSKILHGNIQIGGSKSISNRVLIIRALSGESFPVRGLSEANDTIRLQSLLASGEDLLDAGDGGTTFRFLLAYLCLKGRACTLTGSANLQKRPVGHLVEPLRTLGADIAYLSREGYPPLKINPSYLGENTHRVTVRADISSQFISALLMIGPYLPKGLVVDLQGNIVSKPYLEMTIRIMQHFGAQVEADLPGITIHPGNYTPRKFHVEPDYSSASYYYGFAALAEEVEVTLEGFSKDSVQGDSVIVQWLEEFDVHSAFTDAGLVIQRSGGFQPYKPVWDFSDNPDLFQTMAVVCAGAGVDATFRGLHNLKIKETNRLQAMTDELRKTGVDLLPVAGADSSMTLAGKADLFEEPVFESHGDHRMAMALAILGMKGIVEIGDAKVVSKSYPGFWDDLLKVGFEIE